jgi:N-acetylmuramoyl-L-alanine amidase
LRKRIIYLITIVLLSLLLISLITFRPSIYGYLSYNDSKPVLSSYGSHGQEVIEIQTRLSRWGYYSGSIDGVYGYKTYSAVRSFQAKNGLNADGVAGPNTLAALGISSPSRSNTSASRDVDLLAHLIYGEARGEPYTGQVAIGGVILNRTRDSRFPKTIAAVIYQPGAFDAVRDGQINTSPMQQHTKLPVMPLTAGTPPVVQYITGILRLLQAGGYGQEE